MVLIRTLVTKKIISVCVSIILQTQYNCKFSVFLIAFRLLNEMFPQFVENGLVVEKRNSGT